MAILVLGEISALGWLVLLAGVGFAVAMWSQHRPHATDHPRRCGGCGADHPSFARFCRHCGQQLD